MVAATRPETVFISYAWESEEHSRWVRDLADAVEELPEFHVLFDQYDLHAGRDLTAFMDKGLACTRIITVITPEYVRKANERTGGVGYESSVISADLLSNQLSDRFVPVLRRGRERPIFLRSKVYVDFREPIRFDEAVQKLRSALLGLTPAQRPSKRARRIHVRLDITGQPEADVRLISDPDNTTLTFDTFVTDHNTQVAYAASRAVAENLGQVYNPLLLYGRSGTGKSHLLHAITQSIRCRLPSAYVLRFATETLVTQMITALRSDKANAFRRAVTAADALLLDDFGFVAGNEHAQDEMFHVLQKLLNRGSQIVATSDVGLSDMRGLEPRLWGLFASGLAAEVRCPDIEARIQIAQRAASLRGMDLPVEALRFLAERSSGNPRELQSTITRISAEATIRGKTLDPDEIRRIIDRLMPAPEVITPNEILRIVAEHYGLKRADITGSNNMISVSFPRQVAIYMLKRHTDLTYPEIGKLFSKHHSTVMYTCNAISEKLQRDDALSETLRRLDAAIRPQAAGNDFGLNL